MKRFEEQEMKKIVNDLTTILHKKPTITEITNYINDDLLNPNDYECIERYQALLVNNRKVRHYIDIYNLKEKTSQRIRNDKNKNKSL